MEKKINRILENQLLIMSSLRACLCAPGVASYGLHPKLRDAEEKTEALLRPADIDEEPRNDRR